MLLGILGISALVQFVVAMIWAGAMVELYLVNMVVVLVAALLVMVGIAPIVSTVSLVVACVVGGVALLCSLIMPQHALFRVSPFLD